MMQFLKNLGVEVEGRRIIIRRTPFIFQFHMFQTNINLSYPECFECPLDCNKFLELFLGETPLRIEMDTQLEPEDLLLLAHIKDISEENYPLDIEALKKKLNSKLHILKFGLIGSDQVGKTSIFELIPTPSKKAGELLHSYFKEITSFPPLRTKIYDYGTQVMDNFISKSPAPLLAEKLKHFYLYLIVTDSTSHDVMTIKTKILPKLKRLSPYAAIIVIANKQDLPERLSAPLIERILGAQTYPLSVPTAESQEFLNQLLNDVILLRIEQMREFNCPFVDRDL